MLTVKRLGLDFPRRNCIDLLTPAEKALHDASQAIENAGAHPLLTEAGNSLHEARRLLADYVDSQLTQEEQS